jgi:hypothetical protein
LASQENILLLTIPSFSNPSQNFILIYFSHQNDITGYTPYGARSRQELAIREQFFNGQGMGPPFGVFVLLLPRNGQFLDEKMLAEAAKIDEFIRHNFPLKNHRTNATETFAQFCRDFCELNEPLRRFEVKLVEEYLGIMN